MPQLVRRRFSKQRVFILSRAKARKNNKSKRMMSLAAAAAHGEPAAQRIQIPSDIDWQMLDKSKFFAVGAALFSGVSALLHPAVVLKTRQQITPSHVSCTVIKNREGFKGLYRGLGTSLIGTVPARALYMAALEVTKSNVAVTAGRLGYPEPAASAAANAVGGLAAAAAAQLVWTPVDVISQRLMARGSCEYSNGVDAFRKIVKLDGIRGLYRGFAISIFTYAPSNAVWWASYSVIQRGIWGKIESFSRVRGLGEINEKVRGFDVINDKEEGNIVASSGLRSDSKAVAAVQGFSAAVAGGLTALVTMPLDTIKTRLQVLEGGDEGGGERRPSLGRTARRLVGEGGWWACYRGLGLRCASMSVSSATMITAYEFLKRLSAKDVEIMS